MIKLDFSELQENGFRIKQLRLNHSVKYRGKNFFKNKKIFTLTEDIVGEKNFAVEYLIENTEIYYTSHLIFKWISIISLIVMFYIFLINKNFNLEMISLGISLVSYFLARKKREDFVMGNLGLGLVESMYNFDINKKYNL